MSPPKPLTAHELDLILGRLDTIVGQAVEVVPDTNRHGKKITSAERARRRAESYAPGIRSGLHGDPRGPVGEPGRPTEAKALADDDPSAGWQRELAIAARAADAIVGRLAAILTTINAHAAPEYDDSTGTRSRRLGAGPCLACGHDATGVDDDRLRGGLCNADRVRWHRVQASFAGDRGAWIRERRIENGLDPLTPEQRAMADDMVEALRNRPRR
jgi:hypothetical protein